MPAEAPGAAVICGTVILGVLGISVVFTRPDPWMLFFSIVTAALFLGMLKWEMLVGLMIGVGFFAGTLRMTYGNWVAYLIPEILVAFVLIRWVFGRMSPSVNLPKPSPVIVAFGFFVSYGALEFLHPGSPLIRSFFGFRSWFVYTALLLVGYDGYRDRRQVDFLTRIIVILGLITSAYGIWQWVIGPERLAELGTWYAAHARTLRWGQVMRVSASYSVSGAFSANMGLITLLALGSYLSPASSVRWKLFCVSAIAVMSCGMAVSGSRMGPALLLVGIAVILLLLRRFKALVWILVALSGGLWLISRVSGSTLLPRFATMLDPAVFFWKWVGPLMMGIVEIVPNPIGYGMGYAAGLPNYIAGDDLVAELKTGAVVDSGYGLAGFELGLVGMLLLIFFALRVSTGALRAWRNLAEPASKEAFLGPAVWGVSFPVTLLFASMSATAPLSMYQWVLIGMLLRAGTEDRRPTPARRPHSIARPRMLTVSR